MKSGPLSPFHYNFRVPGRQVDGPIRYAVGQTVHGMVLVGRSRQGICAIFLGENAQDLYEQLAVAFPDVELMADRQSLLGELGQVVAFVDKGTAESVIDLDIGGTSFQQGVWRSLCAIPRGQTRSYGEFAQHLGVPEAVRAVAGACAANVLAVAIPCHRIVRSDGTTSGYRWGVDRKHALLANERGQGGPERETPSSQERRSNYPRLTQGADTAMTTLDLFQRAISDERESIGPCAFVLRGFALSYVDDLIPALAGIAASSPFRNMVTPGGFTMSVALTNCGPMGWTTDRQGCRYTAGDPDSGKLECTDCFGVIGHVRHFFVRWSFAL